MKIFSLWDFNAARVESGDTDESLTNFFEGPGKFRSVDLINYGSVRLMDVDGCKLYVKEGDVLISRSPGSWAVRLAAGEAEALADAGGNLGVVMSHRLTELVKAMEAVGRGGVLSDSPKLITFLILFLKQETAL